MPGFPLRILTLGLALGFAAAPLIGSGFGGFDPAHFPVPVPQPPAQPPGWAFTIWGPIYLGLILAAALPFLRPAPEAEGWNRAAGPLAVSLGIGLFWIETAARAPVAATGMALLMAAAAVIAMRRGGTAVWQVWPLGVYAGWLTAASGIALSVVLAGYGIMGAQAAALLMLALMLTAALAIAPRRAGGWPYRLAVIWALAGVIAANIPRDNGPVIGLCGVGIALLAVDGLVRRRRRPA